MNLFEKVKKLCDEKDLVVSRLEQELGFGNGTIRKWAKTIPSGDRLAKVADYFRVSVDFLLERNEDDEKDIARTMEKIKRQLITEQGLMFDGEVLDEETTKLLFDAIEQQERTVKAINKKYIPKKYRK